jgi:hypothetical protein
MHNFNSLIVAAALVLAASLGGWTVLTTSKVAAKAPYSGSLFAITPVF